MGSVAPLVVVGRPVGARRSGAPSRRPVRLTRRGRALVVLVLVMATLVAIALLSRGPVDAATGRGGPVVSHVTVAPGETLWHIAAREAPAADRRDMVDRIIELNGLRGAGVMAGQQIAVPLAD